MKKIYSIFILFLLVMALPFVFSEDTDGDGIDDIWEARNFGNISQKSDGDFDNDGITNIEEFEQGTSPIVKDKPGIIYYLAIAAVIGFFVLLSIIILSKIKKKSK